MNNQNWQLLAASKTITIHSSQSDSTIPIAEYNPHRGIVNCAVYNHTGKVIASCGQDGKIALHSAQRCQDKLLQLTYYNSQQEPSSVNCCLFSPKSKFIGAGSVNSTVKVWDMKSASKQKQLLHKLKGHSGAITSIGWVNNQQIIASSSTSGDIFLHDLATGAIRESLTSRMQQGINNIKVSEGQGYRRLGACTNSGTLMIWDLNISAKKPIYTYEDPKKSSFTCLSISYFSPVLTVCSSIDSNFLFMDINQKKVIKNVCTQEPLTSIAFNDDGQMLAAGGMSGSLLIYDLRKIQSPLFKLNGHDTPIKSVCFTEKEKDKQKQKIKQKERQYGATTYSRTTNPVQNLAQNKQQKNKVLTPVLSTNKLSTEQQKIGNQRGVRNLTKKQQTVSKTIIQQKGTITQPSYNNNYIETQPIIVRTQSTSATNIGTTQPIHHNRATTSQIVSPSQYNNDQTNHPQSLKVLQQKFVTQMKNMQIRINQKFEMMHLQIIRQSQLSVQKMAACFEKKYLYQKQLQNRIKQLQQQNENLKKRTY